MVREVMVNPPQKFFSRMRIRSNALDEWPLAAAMLIYLLIIASASLGSIWNK
jgi:hypothetical protein